MAKYNWSFLKMSHSDPLVLSYGRDDYLRSSPEKCLKSVLSGESLKAMVSLVSYIENMDRLKMIDGPLISFRNQSVSTLLISRDLYLSNDIEIAVSGDTRTTEFYMERVLEAMGVRFNVKRSTGIEASDLLDESPYALVIGDEALKVYRSRYRILLDIGYEFSRIFQMIPVYAVSTALSDSTVNSEDFFLKTDQFRSKCTYDLSDRLGISGMIVSRYYSNLSYLPSKSTKATIDFVLSFFRQ
jgi:predicted solute-binding protein